LIDRISRDKLAEMLRRFISGQITNFDFEDEIPSSTDFVISEIYDSMWLFYDDFTKHKLEGEWALPKETKKLMARWVIFLHSNEEYKWPTFRYAGVRPLEHNWLSRILKKPEKERKFMESGNYDVWPFINLESYNDAKQNPKLLSGS
jgi:hypothetical protein